MAIQHVYREGNKLADDLASMAWGQTFQKFFLLFSSSGAS